MTIFNHLPEIDKVIAASAVEIERIKNQMDIAFAVGRSDRQEWKARYLALIDAQRAFEKLKVQVLVTQRIPVA